MDNQRVFLWIALAFVAYLNWQAWRMDYGPAPVPAPAVEEAVPPEETDADLPGLPDSAEVSAGVAEGDDAASADGGRMVRIVTDVLDLGLNTRGGDLQRSDLLRYPVRKDRPDDLVRLLDPAGPDFFVFRSGLRAAGGASEPNHQVIWTVEQGEYRLGDGQDRLEVPLSWSSPDGLAVRKVYTLTRGGYEIGLRYEVRNDTGAAWQGASYLQLRRRHRPVDRSMTDVDSYSYRGPILYDGDKYEKLDLDDLAEQPLRLTATGGWVASIQHHFLAAAIPPIGQPASFTASLKGDVYTLSGVGELKDIAPGASAVFEDTLFVGPKLQDQLREAAPGLVLSVDYGFLTIIAQPLFWVLDKLHGLTGNWGWAIILLTVLIKLVFYKLSETSGKSMAKMRNLQPRIKQLQERYGEDRQALSQAMMQLYKREKVNPAAGCLPILVQMPVFLALYWVLLESVEMRQAPFALWINDLSSRDPYFILPILMGVTMFAQQKLNPAPPDPIQAKVMMALPIVFTVFFAFFPAGLVLYWFVNNLLSIAQQWKINRVVERGG
jgi:YidC/Oxa1 family membrane protein insertase